MYKVSVLIPVYKGEKYFDQLTSHLLNQTVGFNNLEVIFCDNNSPDNVKVLCLDFCKIHKNCTYINEAKQGIAHVRRKLMHSATAEYFVFCDCDDYYLPNGIKKLYAGIIKKKCDVLNSYYLNGSKLRICRKPLRNFDIFGTVWANIFKTSFVKQAFDKYEKYVKNIEVKNCMHEEYFFYFPLILSQPKTSFLYKKTYFYSYVPCSATHAVPFETLILKNLNAFVQLIKVYIYLGRSDIAHSLHSDIIKEIKDKNILEDFINAKFECKNVLIISDSDYTYAGGVEKYNNYLINLLIKNNFKTSYLLFKSNSDQKRFVKKVRDPNPQVFFSNEKKYFDLLPYYDKIILSGGVFMIKGELLKQLLCLSKKTISVQHGNGQFLLTRPQELTISENIFCFTKNDVKFFKDNGYNSKKFYYGIANQNNKLEFKNKKLEFNYFSTVKNKEFLNEICKNLNIKVDIYGTITPDKYSNLVYKGTYTDVNQICDKYPIIIIPSYTGEGMPFLVLEAYQNSTPAIIYDIFNNAKFLNDNGKNGLLLQKEWTAKECANHIKTWYDSLTQEKYNQLQRNVFNFSKTIKFEDWEEQWLSFLKN